MSEFDLLRTLLAKAARNVEAELEVSRAVSDDLELAVAFLARGAEAFAASGGYYSDECSDDGDDDAAAAAAEAAAAAAAAEESEKDAQLHTEINAVLNRARALMGGAPAVAAATEVDAAEEETASADAAPATKRPRRPASLPKSFCDARAAYRASEQRADIAARDVFERNLARWQWSSSACAERRAVAALPEACAAAVAWGKERLSLARSTGDVRCIEEDLARFERAALRVMGGGASSASRSASASAVASTAAAPFEWGTPRTWLLAPESSSRGGGEGAAEEQRRQLALACGGSLSHLMMRVDSAIASTLFPALDALAAAAAANERDERAFARFGVVFRLVHSLLCHEGRRSCTFLRRGDVAGDVR